MSHVFKSGDRVWFEGKKYTLVKSTGSSLYPLALQGRNAITFTNDGKQCDNSPKPSLKPVKKKKRQEVWVVFDELQYPIGIYSNELFALRLRDSKVGSTVVRFVKAKEQG